MNATRSYAPPYEVGHVLYGGAVGQVVASRTPAFTEGDIVLSNKGWREYFVSDGRGLERIAPAAPLSYYLGVLGMPGMTAYVGLLAIGQPKAGETVKRQQASPVGGRCGLAPPGRGPPWCARAARHRRTGAERPGRQQSEGASPPGVAAPLSELA
jgi:NADPH-dependent curcumin reductase